MLQEKNRNKIKKKICKTFDNDKVIKEKRIKITENYRKKEFNERKN